MQGQCQYGRPVKKGGPEAKDPGTLAGDEKLGSHQHADLETAGVLGHSTSYPYSCPCGGLLGPSPYGSSLGSAFLRIFAEG